MNMSNNKSDLYRYSIYKLFFDDIQEIFLDTISFRLLMILTLITFVVFIGIFIVLFHVEKDTLFHCFTPFFHALISYDVLQFITLTFLKYNFNENFFHKYCGYLYYLKAVSESGQCLTIIFLLIFSRYQMRYYLRNNFVFKSKQNHSHSLIFICLLFVIYVNNWITHVKIEKMHLVTLNETKYEIDIQEIPTTIYDTSTINNDYYQRFIIDLDKYSQGYDKKVFVNHQQDDSTHEIVIKLPLKSLFNKFENRTKRELKTIENDAKSNKTSYKINHCTYGQKHFLLTSILSLLHSIVYFILILYYLITMSTYKIANTTIVYNQQQIRNTLLDERNSMIEKHKQFMLLLHSKQFLDLIIYSHAIFTFIRLIYTCSLTIVLYLIHTPFIYQSVKIIFYLFFIISYLSIPLRIILLFIFLFLHEFLPHIQSILFYVWHTKMHLQMRFENPTTCFRLKVMPDVLNSIRNDCRNHPDMNTLSNEQSNPVRYETAITINKNNLDHHIITTNMLGTSNIIEHGSIVHFDSTIEL